MRKNVGDRIKALRERAGMSQAELARRIHVSRPTITQWESRSTKNIREDNLIALAKAFGISVDELLTGEPPAGTRETRGTYTVNVESRDEELLIQNYRRLGPDDQAGVQRVVDAFARAPQGRKTAK
ncbi:MAG: helix-turn-helix transcriptional regulator [Gammaproteobacteria bacterium]